MRILSLSAAIAAVLGSAGASAASYDLYISGASAQRTFWSQDMVTSICGGGTVTTKSLSNPDNAAYRCTVPAVPTSALPAGIAAGDVITLHYSAELGSIWGISPFLADYVDPNTGHVHTRKRNRLFVNFDSTDTLSTYSNKTETFSSTPNNDLLISQVPDIGVSDADPVLWSSGDNWVQVQDANPANNYQALDWIDQTAGGTFDLASPSLNQLNGFQTSGAEVMNGQVFSVITNLAGPLNVTGGSLTDLSKASLSAIFTGKYKTWGQVPEVGAGNTTNIKICRRDHGSGTQVSASVFLTGTECGLLGAPRYVSATAGNGFGTNQGNIVAGNIVEATTTGNVRSCVTGDTGGIGITSLGVNAASYRTLTINGVQPNAHNGSSGFYGFAFESWAYDNTVTSRGGAGSIQQNLYTALKASARAAAKLTPGFELGAQNATNGQWDVGGNPSKSNFALGSFNAPVTLTKWKGSASAASVSLNSRGGSACKVPVNSNTAL